MTGLILAAALKVACVGGSGRGIYLDSMRGDEPLDSVYMEDTFAAGLGEENDVHPRNKIPFAELAIEALEKAGK